MWERVFDFGNRINEEEKFNILVLRKSTLRDECSIGLDADGNILALGGIFAEGLIFG